MTDTTTPKTAVGTSELGVEVAARSIDSTALTAKAWRKDFVLLRRDYDEQIKADLHARNRRAFRLFMLSQGLRFAPDVEPAVTTKDHSDGKSIILTYTLEATLAGPENDYNVEHGTVDGDAPEVAAEPDEDEAAEPDDLDPPKA